jgi:thioredoxin 1
MVCLFGVCIPDTVLWPVVLLFIKQFFEFIKDKFALSKSEKKKKLETTKIQTSETLLNSNLNLSDSEEVQYLNEEMDFKSLIESSKTTFVRFTAKWCKPCKQIDPCFNELFLENKQGSHAQFLNVDVDDNEEVATAYSAFQIPYFICFRGGKVVETLKGSDENKLKIFVNKMLYQQAD